MQDSDAFVDRHYGLGGILEQILAGLQRAGKDLDALTVDDLAPVDAFHTRGRQATNEVAALGGLRAEERVLDIGCGLGGTARHLAGEYDCQVTGIDLTAEYVVVGNRLNAMVGLKEKVALHQGSALSLPVDEASFDVAWTEHVQMNIRDKDAFYAEAARVLKPGGFLLFHDIFKGEGAAPVYPVPWAEEPSLSYLVTPVQARSAMALAGLAVERWEVKTAESLTFFEGLEAHIAARGFPPVGLHILMGDNSLVKLGNLARNLSEDRVRVVMGLARKT